MASHRRRPRTVLDDDERAADGRIFWIEVIGYTSVILLIAVLMSGAVDVMLPWG